jgi:hypothetical protein
MTMYLLAEIFPTLRRLRLPFSRDQAMLFLAAVMELLIGVEVYTGHLISGTIVPNEWIPIIFGPVAGVALIVAGLVARRRRPLATIIGNITFLGSIVVGLLGAYFHLRRAMIPAAPIGQVLSLDLLIWAPPVIAPLMFSLIGALGISAVWREEPVDSGRLALLRGRYLQLPLSKTRAFFLWAGLGMLSTVVSSVMDHARAGYHNPWLWVATCIGIFATVVTIMLGAIGRPRRLDLVIYFVTMLIMIVTGPIGTVLHLQAGLAMGTIVSERLLRGAPVMAPLLFSNMGLLGLIILLDPTEPMGREKGILSPKPAL